MKYYINIILIILIVIIASCGKKEDEICPTEFELPSSQFTPYDSLYKIGDTITITSTFSKYLYEKNTGETYNMENIIWNSVLGAFKIDSGNIDDAFSTDIRKYFKIVNCSDTNATWYTFSDGATSLELKYSFYKDSFMLSLSITPKKKGVFIIAFGSGLDNSNQEFEGKCNNKTFNAYCYPNKGKENNIELLKQSPINHFNNWILQNPDDRYYEKKYFALKVIE